jgi:hypothetical protein
MRERQVLDWVMFLFNIGSQPSASHDRAATGCLGFWNIWLLMRRGLKVCPNQDFGSSGPAKLCSICDKVLLVTKRSESAATPDLGSAVSSCASADSVVHKANE